MDIVRGYGGLMAVVERVTNTTIQNVVRTIELDKPLVLGDIYNREDIAATKSEHKSYRDIHDWMRDRMHVQLLRLALPVGDYILPTEQTLDLLRGNGWGDTPQHEARKIIQPGTVSIDTKMGLHELLVNMDSFERNEYGCYERGYKLRRRLEAAQKAETEIVYLALDTHLVEDPDHYMCRGYAPHTGTHPELGLLPEYRHNLVALERKYGCHIVVCPCRMAAQAITSLLYWTATTEQLDIAHSGLIVPVPR